MPAVPVPNAGELTLEFNGAGATWHNVLGLRFVAGLVLDETIRDQIRQAVVDAWVEGDPSYRSLCIDETFLVDIRITDLRVVPRPVWSMGGGGFPGLNTGVILPPQSSICVSLSTNHPTRRGRGRVFLGGWGANNVVGLSNNLPSETARQQSVEFIEDIRDNLTQDTGGQAVLAVVSYADLTPYAVTDVAVRSPRWCTQRRRAG